MDFIDLSKVVAKWWMLVTPIVVLSAMAAFSITSNIQPEFTAEGSILLVSPTDPAAAAAENPLLIQSSALTTTARVAAISANSPQVEALLYDEGFDATFNVWAEGGAPIIRVETRAGSREAATASALHMVEIIDTDLRLRQEAAGAPASRMVTTSVIDLSAVGGADYGGRTRFRLAIVVLGMSIAVAVAVIAEMRSRSKLNSSSSVVEPLDEVSDVEAHVPVMN